jgi:hypothetical protein
MSGYNAAALKKGMYRLNDSGDGILSLGDELLLDLCGRLGRSGLLGLKRNRCECVRGGEGMQDSLGLRKLSEQMLRPFKGRCF